MPTIAIVGVGAIGGVLAGLLKTAAATHEITLCTRRPLPSLRVDTPEGPIHVTAEKLTDPSTARPVDWVFVATKTYDAAGAATWFPGLPGLCGPDTRVAIIQNGVEHRQTFAPYLPPKTILPVVIDVPCERRPDGSVLQRSAAVLRVPDDSAGHAFAALFAGTLAQVELTADFLTAAWSKLCLNSAGILSALVLKPTGVMHDEALGRAALGIIAECVAVGRAEGAKLSDGIPEKVLAGYRAGSPDSINSMLADRMAARPLELDTRNGVIVRLGEKHGIPTPANRMAIALLKAMLD